MCMFVVVLLQRHISGSHQAPSLWGGNPNSHRPSLPFVPYFFTRLPFASAVWGRPPFSQMCAKNAENHLNAWYEKQQQEYVVLMLHSMTDTLTVAARLWWLDGYIMLACATHEITVFATATTLSLYMAHRASLVIWRNNGVSIIQCFFILFMEYGYNSNAWFFISVMWVVE